MIYHRLWAWISFFAIARLLFQQYTCRGIHVRFLALASSFLVQKVVGLELHYAYLKRTHDLSILTEVCKIWINYLRDALGTCVPNHPGA
jgi:hypothetical protein